MFGNDRKIEKRILSVILVMAMTVSLLSGCGQKQETADIPDTAAWETAKDEAVSTGAALVEASDQTEALMESLKTAVEKEDCQEMASLVDELADSFEDTKTKTEEWLSKEAVLQEALDEETAGLLQEREDRFRETLSREETNAENLLADIKKAAGEQDAETAAEKTEALRRLLVPEKTPKTYGESLPNEVILQESEEEPYEENNDASDSQTAGPSAGTSPNAEEGNQAVGEAASDELLITEGDTRLTASIKEKAEELETPLAIYRYLKNNIGYEYYYGSRKGAAGTMDSLGGNDIDQASLLIAMLRHQGCQAEYVKGNILLTEEQALSLTGAATFRQAADVLASAGTPVTRLMRGEEIVCIRMEHVWVRASIPYTDYRGAGTASGDPVWMDLDTGIKEYEDVTNIYDTLEADGFSGEVNSIMETGDTSQLEALLSRWEEQLEAKDLSETYARKRIIKQEENSYLPLSLQYTVEEETETFTRVADSLKDSVSFEAGGEVLASFKASDIQGKDILLSYQPASTSDQTIFDSYGSIFDIPAYAVYMKPVLMVDGEVVAQGEEYLESTLGTKSPFTIHISSGGKSTSVTNEVTTGSMYAVTLDSQNITAPELQGIYDEVSALKDSVTEENVYSEDYLGKLLSLAGKLYFAQVDIADTIASDLYDVAVTRSLSEGITGYEVQTTGLYGMVTGISEGSLYIDVDTDSHSVISLEEDSDVAREYFLSTGMVSSLYESTVWEEITGQESVSMISILAKASEENIDILLLSRANLSTEIEKLNTDETTKQSIMNAVNSGMMVTVPAEEVTMGDWSGTGYIVTNPATGVGEYMISGGLNGGAVAVIAAIPMILASFASILAAAVLIAALMQFLAAIIVTPFLFGASIILLALIFVTAVELNRLMWTDYMDYIFTGNFESYEEACQRASRLGELSIIMASGIQLMQSITILEYCPTSGVTLSSTPGKTTTILGRYEEDTKYIIKELNLPRSENVTKANPGGFNLLNAPDNLYSELGKEGFWLQYNKPFLDAAIERNDVIIMATPITHEYIFIEGTNELTGYGRELYYLVEHGYHYVNGRMILRG